MPTFKAEITNKRADGTYNVRIRVTHNRGIRRISTNLYITDEDITKSGKIKTGSILDKSNAIIKTCRETCNEMGGEIFSMSIEAVTAKLKTVIYGGESFKLDFIAYTEKKIPELSKGTADIYKAALNTLRRFIKCDKLDVSEITVGFLRRFQTFIESEPSKRGSNRKKGEAAEEKGNRAVSLYMSCIRAMHNRAKEEHNDEDLSIVNIPYSPFSHFKVKPQPRTRKRAIPVELIQKVIDIEYRGKGPAGKFNSFNLAKDCFLLSFMLIGMNSVDIYYAGHPTNNTLIYNRRKTASRREDNAEMRVRIEHAVTHMFAKYKDPTGERLFCFHKHYASFKTFNKIINEGLKQIGKEIGVDRLTLYAARHSWATIARSAVAGIDKATVHEALNHVDKENKITDIYIDKDWSVIWNANAKVLGLFDWSELDTACMT